MHSGLTPVTRLCTCVALFAASIASGQTTNTTATASDNTPPVQLEEYNVSASRVRSYGTDRVQVGSFRDVDPVDVPLTVNVITREVLDAQGARTIFEALKNSAGVTRAQSNGNTADNFAIRGITVENRGNIRLNGSLPVVNLIDLTLENKERVEVLKGATSLYYGFVPPSGIINLVTKRAGPDPLTSFQFGLNEHGARSAHFDVGRRFGPEGRLGLRMNVARSTEDVGIDYSDGEREFLSFAFDWKLHDRFLLRYDYEHLKKEVVEQTNIRQLSAVAGVIPLPPMPPNTGNFGAPWQRNKGQMNASVLRADFIINHAWTLVAEAGHARTFRSRLSSDFRNYSLTTGVGQVQTTFNPAMRYQNDNIRVELYGRFRTGPVQHNLSVGYTSNDRDAPVYNNGTVNQTQNLFTPTPLPQPTAPTATTVLTTSIISDTGKYVYDRMMMFDERVQVIGGVRFTDFQSDTFVATTNNTTGVTTTTAALYSVKDEVTPMASVSFKPTPKSSLYVSYLKALEAGQTAGNAQANAGFTLPPLESRQYEIGGKIEWHGVLFQAAYFDIERPSTFINAANFLTANGKASYKGFELFGSGELFKDLSLIGSFTWLDAEQINRENAATFGKIPEGTAKYTASCFAEWRPARLKGLSLSAGAFYVGNRPLDNNNQGFVGGYTTYSAGGSYAFKLGRADCVLRVTSENLTDKNAWAGIGGSLMSTLLPRTIKCSLTTRF